MVTKRLVRIEEGKVVVAAAVDDEENLNQLPKNSNGNGDADTKKTAPPTKKPGDKSQLGSIDESENCHGRSKQDASAHFMPTDDKIDGGKSAASAVPTVGQRKSSRHKKRHIPWENHDANGKKQRTKIDFSDVPAQLPILKSGFRKGGTSKYQGVSFNKSKNKWQVNIMIDRKAHYIGIYDDEEDAAMDYARAVFKYVPKKQKDIDLTDVPDQPLILKSGGRKGRTSKSSKYQGVSFKAKSNKKWWAQIVIDGKTRHIGFYDSEEAAAMDYARAAFKYIQSRK